MAAAEKIKALLESFGTQDEGRFYSTAMQIAASEAKRGHTKLAQELKTLIDKIKVERNTNSVVKGKNISIIEAQRELQDLLEVERPRLGIENMVLSKNVQESLNRILNEQSKLDILLHHNLEPRRKLLLVGPPGCGKTMTAKAIAGNLDIPLFIVRLDGLISRYMGESIAKLRLIFDSMYQHRAVYLFDEFDSIGTNRNYGNDVGEIKRVLNSFLMNIEKNSSRSIIIAATNLPESLDKALFRRFDDVIKYPLPSEKEIYKLIKHHFINYKMTPHKSLTLISKNALGLSFAEITSACNDAIKKMILEDSEKISSSSLLKYIELRKETF